jgi:2-aminoadipate transaminase
VGRQLEHLRLSRRGRLLGEQPVNYLMEIALVKPEIISLAAGFVDQDSLPAQETLQAAQELLSDPAAGRAALQYGTTKGFNKLRELVLAHVAELDRCSQQQLGVGLQNVLLTTGSQQLLQLLSDVLIDPGDIVLVGAPDYFVYMGTLSSLGARIVGVPMDEAGLIPEALDEAFEQLERAGELPRVKLLYCCSYCQNPAGVTLEEERRPEVLALLRRWSKHGRILLLEDAAYRELAYYGEPPRSIRFYDEDGSTVVLAQTFSKSFSPGLRVGYALLPVELMRPVLRLKGTHDFGSPNFNLYLMAELIENGGYARQVQRLKQVYKQKLEAMLEALDRWLTKACPEATWTRPLGGLYVWVCLPQGINTDHESDLFNRCVDRGVLYVPGEYCFPHELPCKERSGLGGPEHTLRLCYGVQPVERVVEGVRRFAEAVAEVG